VIVGWLVGWFVRSFIYYACSNFLKNKSLIFMKFGTDVQHLRQILVLIFQKSTSNRHTENLLIVIARCGLRYQIWKSDRSNFGMKYDFHTELKMAAWLRFALPECLLVYCLLLVESVRCSGANRQTP